MSRYFCPIVTFFTLYWDKNTGSFWTNIGKFSTLLCLADQPKRHGQIRWYWEGTSWGYTQQLKEVLISMPKKRSYFAAKLKLMFPRNEFKWYRGQLLKPEGLGVDKKEP